MITYKSFVQQNSPLFSILIPTWNNLDFLKLCIHSIRKNSRYYHQVILHINDGQDGSREWAESEKIDFSSSQENIGVCYALNAAFSLAKADYIVYMNDDMYACPDWDYYLMDAIQQISHERFYLSATAIEPKDVGKKCAITPYSFGRSPSDFDEARLMSVYPSLAYEDWNGASWPPNVVHRKLWELVGGYSTEFFPGFYSDPDFAMKLWQAGVREFRGVSKSRVYHFLEVSTNKYKKQMVKKANALFLRKWGITARVFNRYYLKIGTPYIGAVSEPLKSFDYLRDRFFCIVKRLFV